MIIDTGNIVCYFDGSCEPKNPGGNMGFGGVIFKGDKIFSEVSEFVRAYPTNTNNVAEYEALYLVMNELLENGLEDAFIIVRGDSKLAINQMSGAWKKAKKGAYVESARRCKQLLEKFSNIHFEWIPREENTIADRISKEGQTEFSPYTK